ncbi:MAG: hypothetical protein Q9159_005800 [Coniocarpon cinnabarinum]
MPHQSTHIDVANIRAMPSSEEQIDNFRSTIKPAGTGRLNGKIAIVTGGSSSIGRAICLAYAREGARVVVADLRTSSTDPSESVATHELISRAGGHSTFSELNVVSSSAFDSVVDSTFREHGRLDILVNNAGVSVSPDQGSERPIWEHTDQAFDLAMDVNGKGVFNGTRGASRVMVKQEPGPSGDRGWIINIASIYGLTAFPNLDVQTPLSSRAWDAKDEEVKKQIESLHPFKGVGTAEDIAPVAVFLASEDARWVTGTGIPVDGPLKLQLRVCNQQ